MSFEIKIKVTCAVGDAYCYHAGDNNTLQIGLLPESIDEGHMSAMDYFYMRRSYLACAEKHCEISAFIENHSSGLAPLYELLGIPSDPFIYMDWRGTRRGVNYQVLLYVYIMGDSQYQNYIDEFQKILVNSEASVSITQFEVDNSNVQVRPNGSFVLDSPFHNDFIKYDEPHRKHHVFFRDNEDEIYIFEKYTVNSDQVSWDKELPAEGDNSEYANWFLAALQIVIPLIQGCIAKHRIEKEKRLIRTFHLKIIHDYPIRGYLILKAKNAMNKSGRRIHVFQDIRGTRIFAEYEVEVRSGKVRRIRFKQ